jgi:hypothetical protein
MERAGSADSGTPDIHSGGGGAHPTSALAHQYLVRLKLARELPERDLFGLPWDGRNLSLADARLREIGRETAGPFIEQYEWLGCLPAVTWHCFGLYFDGLLGAVVTYGPEYSENLGKLKREGKVRACADWSRYGFEGKMILLSRGACAHWTPPNTGSKIIRLSMRMLDKKYEVITATVDPAAGEIGTIYQACGFHYVGSMRKANPKVTFREQDRHAWMINGKIIGSRTMRARIGSTKHEEILRHFPSAVVMMQHSKGRYFAFRGPNAATHFDAIRDKVLPYPKRLSRCPSPVPMTDGVR